MIINWGRTMKKNINTYKRHSIRKKQFLVGLSSLIFAVFVGCGGDSGEAKTPPQINLTGQQTPDDQKTQEAIAHWAQEAVSSCSNAACSFAQATGPTLAAIVAANIPVQLNQVPTIQATLSQASSAAEQGCANAFKQLKMNADTASGGTYMSRPDVRAWFEMAVLRPIGTQGAQCLPQQAFMMPGFLQAATQLGGLYAQNMMSKVNGLPSSIQDALKKGLGF